MGVWSVDDDHNEIGAICWIKGELPEAISWWRKALKCKYGDSARNMTPALLLYFAAVRTGDEKLKKEAVAQIEKKLKTGWSQNWPAPLGRFLIGIEAEDHVEGYWKDYPQWDEPDERCRFDFYRGVRQLERGDDEAAMSCFRSAVDQPNQTAWPTEFVLARHELGES
jgi:hypothetical protein